MKKRNNYWRCGRIALAAAAFVLVSYSVWDKWHIRDVFLTQAAADFFSLSLNITVGAGCALLGIVTVTLLCGRVYCSVLCPLGIMQDLMSLFRKTPYRRLPWKGKVRGAVFFAVSGLSIAGFLLPLALLLPSSNFVMIVNNVFREAVQWLLGGVLAEPVSIRPMAGVQIVSWLIFAGLFLLVRWNGRTYCNTLCPVGALLGYCAKPAWFKIAIDPDRCVSCGQCEKICKAGAIDSKAKRVNFDECVMCLNCLSVCPKDALGLHHKPARKEKFRPDRRTFLKDSGAVAGGFILGNSVKLIAMECKPVMPPGAGTYERFAARCVRCGLCISACSGKVLKAATFEYGVKGLMQPVLDPYHGACVYGCARCSHICPCGALTPVSREEKKTLRIGLAHIHPDRCVAHALGQDCGACAEHCPVGALEMVLVNDVGVPKVNEALCIGCGACQNICPIRPEAAIVVEGVSPQYRIEKPKAVEAVKLQAEEDFPF